MQLFFPFFFSRSGDHRDLHSFPTRRSSDLLPAIVISVGEFLELDEEKLIDAMLVAGGVGGVIAQRASLARSEEHTSELQSQSNLVCRLLLEKKKKNRKSLTHTSQNKTAFYV